MNVNEANVWEPKKIVSFSGDSRSVEQSFVAAENQQVFVISDFAYNLGTNALTIYVDGKRKIKFKDWIELTENSFRLLMPNVIAGTEVIAVGDLRITTPTAAPLESLGNGVWVEGATYTGYNQYLVYNEVAYMPRTTTALPYTVGATPDLAKLTVTTLTDHAHTTGRNPGDGSAHNAADVGYKSSTVAAALDNVNKYKVSYVTSAEIATRDNTLGELLIVSDRGNEAFKIIASEFYDGMSAMFAGTGKVASLVIKDTVPIRGFGSTYEAVLSAVTVGNSLHLPLDPGNASYTMTADWNLPEYGFKGSGSFLGATATALYTKNFQVYRGTLTFESLVLDSCWELVNSGRIVSNGDILIKSGNASWGTYWCSFGHITCAGTLIIDVDQGQSTNQNLFGMVRAAGGVHVRGTSLTGSRECHNNYFAALDTTGADLTAEDSSTGHHILNDSVLNQKNFINMWYAESTGNRTVRGNWEIDKSNVDANNLPYQIDRSCSSLRAGGTQRNGSFLAASSGYTRGGDWRELTTAGLPIGVIGSALTQVSALNAPDGNPLAFKQDGSAADRSVNIPYQLSSDGVVSMTMYVYQEGILDELVALVDSVGAEVQYGVGSYTKLGGGWYLLRVAGKGAVKDEAAGHNTGYIRIFQTRSTPTTAENFRYFGSYYISTEEVCLLPKYWEGPKIAYGTAVPASGKWNVLDTWVHTSPTVGQPKGGTCSVAGTPGTWLSNGVY